MPETRSQEEFKWFSHNPNLGTIRCGLCFCVIDFANKVGHGKVCPGVKKGPPGIPGPPGID